MEKWGINQKLPARQASLGEAGGEATRLDSASQGSWKLDKEVKKKDQFYSLSGREEIIKIRKQREKYSKEKLKIAEKAAKLLKIIPTIIMVAVSGNLAVNNCGLNDDIDFLIVTKRNFLWTTRLLIIVILDLFGLRRKRKDRDIKNKICLNMFIDENHLSLPEKERNLYTAHEVIQLKMIWDREETYSKFIKNNQWVKEYLPNSIRNVKCPLQGKQMSNVKSKGQNSKLYILLEKFLRRIQLYYMSKHRTKEKISEEIIMFHPKDKTEFVLKEYNRKVNNYFFERGKL